MGSRPLLEQRISTALGTMRRLAQLPARMVIDARATALSTTALPQLTYGLQDRPLPKRELARLESAARHALWQGRKKMHSWSAACIFVYRTHRTNVGAAYRYEHCAYVIRALQTCDPDVRERAQVVMQGTPPPPT